MKLSLLSVLNEITARKGPRTGAFEFDQRDVDSIMRETQTLRSEPGRVDSISER
jgi:hypothetical protein